MLEHFEFPTEITQVISEIYRVMKTDGKFEFSIPDFFQLFHSYVGDKKLFKYYMKDFEKVANESRFISDNEHLDLLVRQYGQHKFIYEFSTLKELLEQVGFKNVRIRSKNAYDSLSRLPFSLLISCEK